MSSSKPSSRALRPRRSKRISNRTSKRAVHRIATLKVASLPDLPKDTLMKIVQYLMPAKNKHERWIGREIIQDVLPFACTARSCCEAVLAVFDAYDNVFFDNGVHNHIHHLHWGKTTQPDFRAYQYISNSPSDAILYRAAALAYSVRCSNSPNHEPILLWSKEMVKYHTRCCCCSTSWYILGLLKFNSKSLSIGRHSQACIRRSWNYHRLQLCEDNMCLVKAEVIMLRKMAIESLQVLGLSLYPHQIVTKVLKNLLESCASTLRTLTIRDCSVAVILAICNASPKLERLQTLELDTDLSESMLKTRLSELLSALVHGRVPLQSLSISHQQKISDVSFASLPSTLERLSISSIDFSLPKRLNSLSLRVLHIQCDIFKLSELLRMAKCSELPKLEEVRIHYEKGDFKTMDRKLTAEERGLELAVLDKVSHIHAAFRRVTFPLAVGDLLDESDVLVYKAMFTQVKELSVSFHLSRAHEFAAYLANLQRLTKLRLSTAIPFSQTFSFDVHQIEQSKHLIDALRRSHAPLRSLRLNGLYCTRETYEQMMETFCDTLVRLEMMLHSPGPAGRGLVNVTASSEDVMDILLGAALGQTRLEYIGFGFAVGVTKRRPFNQGGVMETFYSVQERLLDQGVSNFYSDCCMH